MNWYAYKVLADTYEADRRAQTARQRRAREVARRTHAGRANASARTASSALAGRWSSIAARLRRRPSEATPAPVPPAPATPAQAIVPTPADLFPSLPR